MMPQGNIQPSAECVTFYKNTDLNLKNPVSWEKIR